MAEESQANFYDFKSNNIRVGIKEGRVFVEFSESTTGLYMAPVDALTMASLLIETVIVMVKRQAEIIRPA